ncbi:MAG: glycoside hydrolase 100 family protein, partial [Pseudohongiellaceae bacterium]
MHRCRSRVGFLASPTDNDNYRRIWSRDGVILSLAALLTEDPELHETVRETLQTLARYQGPHGEIPSNVDPASQRISYGGTTGRVDASLWFVIGCGEYWKATDDQDFIEQMVPVLEKIRFLLGAWEFNNRGLIYVPQAGDWADEYLHSGYVLYDQLLYLQALRSLRTVHQDLQGTADHPLKERLAHLKHLIQANYWLHNGNGIPDDAYHEILYRKGREAEPGCAGRYWMPFFSPTGYGYRFDAFANILASLLDVADKNQAEAVDEFIQSITPENMNLLPAFYPVIHPPDRDWRDLQMTFSYTFKNKPYEYHNGGLWPML